MAFWKLYIKRQEEKTRQFEFEVVDQFYVHTLLCLYTWVVVSVHTDKIHCNGDSYRSELMFFSGNPFEDITSYIHYMGCDFHLFRLPFFTPIFFFGFFVFNFSFVNPITNYVNAYGMMKIILKWTERVHLLSNICDMHHHYHQNAGNTKENWWWWWWR